jgi:hypothetical protein
MGRFSVLRSHRKVLTHSRQFDLALSTKKIVIYIVARDYHSPRHNSTRNTPQFLVIEGQRVIHCSLEVIFLCERHDFCLTDEQDDDPEFSTTITCVDDVRIR